MILGPRIVIIGNSGSGKSTLARLLEIGIGGEHIDLDRIPALMAGFRAAVGYGRRCRGIDSPDISMI
jgi:predicted kinase